MSTRGLGTVSTNPMVPGVSRNLGGKKAGKTWPGFVLSFYDCHKISTKIICQCPDV